MGIQAPLGSHRLNTEMILHDAKGVRGVGRVEHPQQMLCCSLVTSTHPLNPGCKKPELQMRRKLRTWWVGGTMCCLSPPWVWVSPLGPHVHRESVNCEVRGVKEMLVGTQFASEATNTFSQPCLDNSTVCPRLGKLLEKEYSPHSMLWALNISHRKASTFRLRAGSVRAFVCCEGT